MILKLNSDYAPQHHQPMHVLLRTHCLVNFTAGLKSVHFGHNHVQKDKIGFLSFGHGIPFFAVGGDNGAVTETGHRVSHYGNFSCQIINDQNFARIKKLFDDAVAKGAKIAVGGTLEAADRTIHPTLLTDVTPDMAIMQEEIFGPIVPLLTYENIDDVIEYISRRDKPLALYIYSNNRSNIDKVLSRTSSGGVTVNGFFSHYLENQLPFGGVNQSGMGSYHGVFGFRAFSHERAVYVQDSR